MQSLPSHGKTTFILSHPDDETIVGMGTLARLGILARLGERVKSFSLVKPYVLQRLQEVNKPIVYYATLGEKGNPNGVCTPEQLPSVRQQELNKVADILDFDQAVDHFGDGTLDQPEVYARLVQNVQGFLDKQKPNRVITFPASGLTGHPDHQAISKATTEAVDHYNRQNPKNPIALYFRVITPKEKGIQGEPVHHDPLPVTHTNKVGLFLRKMRQTIGAHATQVPEMGTIYPAFHQYAKRPKTPPVYKGKARLLWKKETYHRVR